MQDLGTIVDLDILAHGQTFVSPRIGDDMLAFRMDYELESRPIRLSEVRFLDSAVGTVSTVRFIVGGSEDYPDIDEVAGIARRIAARVMPPDENGAQSQSAQSAGISLEPFGWAE